MMAFEIKGLNKVTNDMKEFQKALSELDGEIGTVKFDPEDPGSIEVAIQDMEHIIEEKLGRYSSNPFAGPMMDQIKETMRDQIIQKAQEVRDNQEEEEDDERQ